ncbi:hypothetical protein EDF70_11099 [Neorhizobium sp. JUb45]|nr:hypothetical protein EDF70_11099 [Neorhizobium sp. JUb45]
MTLKLYDATIPVFIQSLGNLEVWMKKALSEGISETAIFEARLAPDMLPFPGQIQRASDTAKNAVARLAGIAAPSMPDTEQSVAELKARCQRTINYLRSIDRLDFDGAENRSILFPYPKLGTLQFDGVAYVTGYALPNFFFHVTTAYALLRANGAALGKADFLRHLAASQ